MQRLVAGRPAALTATFRDGLGVDVAADAVTVEATSRRTGTKLIGDPDPVAAEATSGSPPDASWHLLLDGTEVTQPDVLDVTWHVTVGAATTDRPAVVEFTGAGYVDLGDLQARLPSALPADLIDVISEVSERIEVANGWIWVPRWARITLDTDRHGTAVLPSDPPRRPLRSVLSAVDDDDATVEVAGWDTSRTGVLHTQVANTRLVIDCELGEDAPPFDLAEAAEEAAHIGALEGRAGRGSRARAELPESGVPFQTASLRHGRPFGIDGVDGVVMSHDHRTLAGV